MRIFCWALFHFCKVVPLLAWWECHPQVWVISDGIRLIYETPLMWFGGLQKRKKRRGNFCSLYGGYGSLWRKSHGEFWHTVRGGNEEADVLAKEGVNIDGTMCCWARDFECWLKGQSLCDGIYLICCWFNVFHCSYNALFCFNKFFCCLSKPKKKKHLIWQVGSLFGVG